MKRTVRGYVTLVGWVDFEVEDPEDAEVADIYENLITKASSLVFAATENDLGVTFDYDGHKLWPNPDPLIYGIEGQP